MLQNGVLVLMHSEDFPDFVPTAKVFVNDPDSVVGKIGT